MFDINNELKKLENRKNVIWQVTGLSDFSRILPGFLRTAQEQERRVLYISFSEQPVILWDEYWKSSGGKKNVVSLSLSHRFEAFTKKVYHAVLEAEEGSFILFDSLSDLQTAWATDLMMENFFKVIAPAVKERNATAFYPLLRNRHSNESLHEIRKYTEGYIKLYSDFHDLYIRPSKWDDVSKEEFVPCVLEKETFLSIEDPRKMSSFLKAVSESGSGESMEKKDAWERFFDDAQKRFMEGRDISAECGRMSEIMMSRDVKIRELLKKHFTPVDYFGVREHMIGSGLIGGKACGFLVARKIIENLRPDIYSRMEAHDSFYIGSDVFYTYIVDNGFWNLRVRQNTPEGYFELSEECAEKFRTGVFSENLEKQFIKVLEYYGECPVIVRSSSILEDGFGNAFAGKYESVFCMGKGTMEERLLEFENAIRTVYASTMSKSALDYRIRRGLNEKDEQMSLLVMRVSGSFYGDLYTPCAAGVGYSYSTYRFLDSLDPEAGMLRLVMGLGTSAVDRTEGSYPRLVSLDRPQATSYKTPAEHHRFSQRKIEVINEKTGELERVEPERVVSGMSFFKKNQLMEHDYEAERIFRDRGQEREISFVSCQGLVKNERLMKDMQGIMKVIQAEYNQPVDIEFTINLFDRDKSYLINLLQCRPLQVFKDTGKVSLPEAVRQEEVFLSCTGTSMGLSEAFDTDILVYVDPVSYYNMSYSEKSKVASCIGRINWKYRGQNKKMVLFVPGRIGTSSPELGVPAVFSDISEFSAVFEVAESRAGYNPELSYGSHMFQDLVENGILYAAVFEDARVDTWKPEMLSGYTDCLLSEEEASGEMLDCVKVYKAPDLKFRLYHDMLKNRLIIVKGGQENA